MSSGHCYGVFFTTSAFIALLWIAKYVTTTISTTSTPYTPACYQGLLAGVIFKY